MRFGDINVNLIEAEERIRIYGTHLNLTGRYPIEDTNIHIIGSVGIISLKIKAEDKPIGANGGVLDPDAVEDAKRKYSSRRAISRLSGGLAYRVSDLIGFRLLMSYENTAKFKNIIPKRADGGTSVNRLSLRNNMLYGFGVTIYY